MTQQHLASEWVGGFHAVQSALESGQPIKRVWLASNRRGGRIQQLIAQAHDQDVPVETASMEQLDAWLPDVRHQGCMLEFEPPRTYQESELPALLAQTQNPWVLALDQVQDPHNLGACLRSAAAAGVTAVIAPRKRAAGLTPAARKVAAGAADRLPFVPVTNLSRALLRLKTEGFWIVGLEARAQDSLYEVTLPTPLVWVAGGEARGLRELTARNCDLQVHLPMHAEMESLNVSVATGVALFETVRRQAQSSS